MELLEATKGSVRGLLAGLPKEVVDLVVKSLEEMYRFGEAKGRVSASSEILDAMRKD